MCCSVRPMPQATCHQQEINRGISTPFGKQANKGDSPSTVQPRVSQDLM